MKKIIKTSVVVTIILSILISYSFFGPLVQPPKNNYLYIPTGADFSTVEKIIQEQSICSKNIFSVYSTLLQYRQNIKPGKYRIENNSSVFTLLRKLKSGRQEEVRCTITKLRTKEDLAKWISDKMEPDYEEAFRFLNSNDSLLLFGVDTNTVMTLIIPNTYLFWWNGSMNKIMGRLKKQQDYFWDRRKQQLAAQQLNQIQVYTIASIVEEETNRKSDKPKIASVYINRIRKGMKLEADPTVKYALRDFGLKRIYLKHLTYPSPYNTYYTKGLPPGPICTPSIESIDAVLEAPSTDYLFFVAKPDFNGYSNFSSNYAQHMIYAKQYQAALDKLTKNNAH